MNQFESGILSRCLQLIYHQLLTEQSESALASIEQMTLLIRYLTGRGDSSATLEEEAEIVRAVFQIYHSDGYGGDFSILYEDVSLNTPVRHTAVVYEVCPYGMELIHDGIVLKSLCFRRQGSQLAYHFTDSSGGSYGGTVYGEGIASHSEGQAL